MCADQDGACALQAGGQAEMALTLEQLKKPDLPTAPKKPDLRKTKDPDKIAAKEEAYRVAKAEYNEKMREYKEVLYPAYDKEYQRLYDQSEQRKRQRQADPAVQQREAERQEARQRWQRDEGARREAEARDWGHLPNPITWQREREDEREQQQHQQAVQQAVAAREATIATRKAAIAARDAAQGVLASGQRGEAERREGDARVPHGRNRYGALASMRLLALRSLESQLEPQFLRSSEGFIEHYNTRFAGRRLQRSPAEAYELHMLQASFCEQLGLLARAEQEWRLALDSKPLDRQLIITLVCRHLSAVMVRRARGEYGQGIDGNPGTVGNGGGERPGGWQNGSFVWREGTAMAALAHRERDAESQRDAPKSQREINASVSKYNRAPYM